MNNRPDPRTEAIRARIDHPIIDSDGHSLEYLPLVKNHLREIGGASLVTGFETLMNAGSLTRNLGLDERRALGLFRLTWWGFPARNALDRATAMLPKLQYERMDELGLDFGVLYPTFGLTACVVDDADLRRGLARAFNLYYAESFRDYRDRLEHVAIIPMHTPEEAIEELEFAVGQLGFKAILMAGFAYRSLPGENLPRAARWVDTFTWESPYDYDPVWAKCVELGVSPTFHSSAMGWHRGNSQTNYVFNHLGNFAAAGETTCRSLFMDGVPRRFPALHFAFLEGGVAWGANLYSDILGHYEKRNREDVHNYNPANLDRKQIRELFDRYASDPARKELDGLDACLNVLADPDEDPAGFDEFARSGVTGVDDIRDIFTRQFHFGCEADDPMNALAFDRRINPHGARLSAILGSDIGHWDVVDCRQAVPEAWELVDEKRITPDDFKAFVCDNPRALWSAGNPDFFADTRVGSRF
jgi:predicted TIM-barrel fold metal-dependent hydrolase